MSDTPRLIHLDPRRALYTRNFDPTTACGNGFAALGAASRDLHRSVIAALPSGDRHMLNAATTSSPPPRSMAAPNLLAQLCRVSASPRPS